MCMMWCVFNSVNSLSWLELSKTVATTKPFRYEQLLSRHRCTSSYASTDSSVRVSTRNPTGTCLCVSLNCLSYRACLSCSMRSPLRPSRSLS
ncbi:hypothetical protein NP493_1355g00012 [Ridgeia piscesae]|uniref:Uncharacterized protein n=1 Tax=Ridgeia piscesae TaxID=27915 RepID=A0AAD9K751_RIDPI|nr:hypothetical protein NP493_1355g00012 [Ridgeia piscesae]